MRPGRVDGDVSAPPSKSVTHRALLMALTAGSGTVQGPLWSADTRATLSAVRAFGAKTIATDTEAIVVADDVRPAEIDAANSGTTLRLTTAIAALADGTSRLTGDASLSRRPMGPLVDALGQLGAEARCEGKDGRPPVQVTGPAHGGTVKVPGDVSSQFVSALLLAGAGMEAGVRVELTSPLTSAPYVDLTMRLMREQGFDVPEATADRFEVRPSRPKWVRIAVPGDYSGAAFPCVAAAITGGTVTVHNLVEASGQGDEALVDHLGAFGVAVTRDGTSVRVEGGPLEAAELDLGATPDLFPPLSVLAAFADGETLLTGAPHLRHKESDRIDAMTEGLRALGVEVEALSDGARIVGGRPTGGTVDAHGDHRIQMAFAVAALAASGPVTVLGRSDVHAVSYPDFLRQLRALGAEVEVQTTEGAAA